MATLAVAHVPPRLAVEECPRGAVSLLFRVLLRHDGRAAGCLGRAPEFIVFEVNGGHAAKMPPKIAGVHPVPQHPFHWMKASCPPEAMHFAPNRATIAVEKLGR